MVLILPLSPPHGLLLCILSPSTSCLKQYNLMKPVKRGIKVWVLADSHNGYFQKFQVYTGKRWWKAPAILSCGSTCIQRAMDSLLQGMANVAAYMDDILVTGESEQERLQNLDSVYKGRNGCPEPSNSQNVLLQFLCQVTSCCSQNT